MSGKPWSREELILALNAYFKIAPKAPSPSMLEIAALSERLRAEATEAVGNPGFRSPASVVMKLMNFRSLDPDYAGVGLRAAGAGDRRIWEEFAGDRTALRTAVRRIDEGTAGADVQPSFGYEGDERLREHLRRERDAALVARRKTAAMESSGRLACEVCGFDFERTYGERGRGFIECHHLDPLSSDTGARVTRQDELALLCANCHRMIHSRRPWLALDELRAILRGEPPS